MTAAGTTLKNQVATAKSWLILAYINATGIGGSVYRRVLNEAAVTFLSQPFSPVAMVFGEVQESLKGDLPKIDMRVSNLDTELNTAMNAKDGLRGATVTVYVVSADGLASGVAEIIEVFTILETSADNQWITFTLGMADPVGRRFPRDRYTVALCRHQYRTTRYEITAFCRYTGVEPDGQTTCDHSLKNCIDRNNTAQFGGSPGVDEGVYY